MVNIYELQNIRIRLQSKKYSWSSYIDIDTLENECTITKTKNKSKTK